MNYFQAYLPSLDQAIVAAWDSQIAEAAETSWLAQALTTKSADLFPRFAARYAELRALPRGARRALQRQLARSHVPANVPAEWQRKLASSLAGAALLLALGQGTAQALVINVDANKTNIKSGDGFCSLIEAIDNANDITTGAVHADCTAGDPAGADDIVLTAGSVHKLTKINNSTYGATGVPVITSLVTVTGNGATIKRIVTAPRFRIFAVSATGDLTLDDVAVRNGRRLSLNGGGVANYGGTVTLTNSTISGNRARYGGGVYNSYGVLTITDSTITGNQAGGGGGVNSYNGTLTITNSTISNNTATSNIAFGYGGGIFSQALTAYFPTTITNCTITGNRARYGGGLLANNDAYQSSLTIDGGTISQNTAVRAGGGILNYAGTMTITNTAVVTNNKAKFGGGIYNSAGELSIDNSTVSNNRATGVSFSVGGGIYNGANATLMVTNSTTISGNRSRYGGGVFNSGYFNIDTSTISTNTATVSGGGVFNYDKPLTAYTFVQTNSTITLNTPDQIYP